MVREMLVYYSLALQVENRRTYCASPNKPTWTCVHPSRLLGLVVRQDDVLEEGDPRPRGLSASAREAVHSLKGPQSAKTLPDPYMGQR